MKSIGLLIFCLMLAGCGATTSTTATSTSVQADRPAGEFFESEDYIVVVAKSGDTTQNLAAKYLGDANKDWMIEDYNGTATIAPGQAVAIPKRPWNLSGVTASGYQLVPILTYHDLAPAAKGRMVMGAKGFEEQMRYLKANGYRVITLKEYVEFVSLQRQLPKKSVLITFDDGYRSFLRYGYPGSKSWDSRPRCLSTPTMSPPAATRLPGLNLKSCRMRASSFRRIPRATEIWFGRRQKAPPSTTNGWKRSWFSPSRSFKNIWAMLPISSLILTGARMRRWCGAPRSEVMWRLLRCGARAANRSSIHTAFIEYKSIRK